MRFSKYRAHLFIFSLILGLIMFGVTYLKYGGFARSISFDGGIRFSILMPSGTGYKELETAVKKVGFDDYQIRLSNMNANQFDLELGPRSREKVDARIKEAEKREETALDRQAVEKRRAAGLPAHSRTITGEIERELLPALNLSQESIVSREAISPSFASDLAGIALWGFNLTIILIGVYLYFRFTLPFAIGAIFSLIHDVLLAVGFIGFMQIEPSTPVLAAVLTLIGYSINDTIVIFDRIRENVQDHQQFSLPATMDLAMTQTLSRTIVTSLLTLLSVLALFFGGATSLKDFATVLTFGIIIGTYSSIFIAAHSVQYYDEFFSWIKERRQA